MSTPGSPTEAARQTLAEADVDFGLHPNKWAPWEPEHALNPLCDYCACATRSIVKCWNADLTPQVWFDTRVTIPDSVIITFMYNLQFTELTTALANTITTNMVHLDMCYGKFETVEVGALRAHTSLRYFMLCVTLKPFTWQPGVYEGLVGLYFDFFAFQRFQSRPGGPVDDTVPEAMYLTGPNGTMGQSTPERGWWFTYGQDQVRFAPGVCCDRFPKFHTVYIVGSPELGPSMVADVSFEGLSFMPFGTINMPKSAIPQLPANYLRSAYALTSLELPENDVDFVGGGAFPDDAAWLGSVLLTANPSICFKGVDSVVGGKPAQLVCDCAEGLTSNGYVNASALIETSAKCVPVQCPATVLIVVGTLNQGATSSCTGASTQPGHTCTVSCQSPRIGSVSYTCGSDGLWSSPTNDVLDCQETLPTASLAALLGQNLTFYVPVQTANVTFDPTDTWESALPWVSKQNFSIEERNADQLVHLGMVVNCIEPPSADNGTLVLDSDANTLSVMFKWRPDRDVEACTYDFDATTRSQIGYISFRNLFEATFRITSLSGAFYERVIQFSRTKLQVAAVEQLTEAAHGTAGQGFQMHTSTQRVTPSQLKRGLYQPLGRAAGVGGSVVFETVTPLLPGGLELSASTGELTGVPTAPGVFSIHIRAALHQVSADGSLEIAEVFEDLAKFELHVADRIEEQGSSGFRATAGSPYIGSIQQVTGGRPPLTFVSRHEAEPERFQLPIGLFVNETTGQISGTPLEASDGTVLMGVVARDANGYTFNLQTVEIAVNLAINITWDTHALAPAVVGQPYTLPTPTLLEGHPNVLYRPLRISADGATTQVSETPPGLDLNYGNGVLYGTPSKPGRYSIELVGTDAARRRAPVRLRSGVSSGSSGSGAESEASSASAGGVTGSGAVPMLVVAECGRESHCSGVGACVLGDDPYDGVFSCACEGGFAGDQCERSEDSSDNVGLIVGVAVAAVLTLLVVGALLRGSGAGRRSRLAQLNKIGSTPEAFSEEELTEALHDAIELGALERVPFFC